MPKLRFPEFNGEWKHNIINELFDKITDYVAAGSFASISENVKYLRNPDFAQLIRTIDLKNKFCNDDFVYVDENGFNYLWRVNLNENSIVLPNIGANIGEIYFLNPDDLPYENNVLAPNSILLKSSTNITFKYHLLSTTNFNKELKLISESSGQPKFNKTGLKKIKLNIPYSSEQEKIASFLSKVDEKIEILEKKQKLWETYKKGIMQQIFSQKLRFKDENGEDYSDWEEKKLKDISTINPKSDSLPEKFIYIDLESVESGVLKKKSFISKFEAPSRAQRVLKNNDILYQTVRPYQRNNFFFNITNSGRYAASTGYAQIRSKEDPKFIYHILHTDDFVNKVLSRCTGTSYPAINSKELRSIRINVPSIVEQKKIAKFISLLDTKIEFADKELEINREFKKGLLQQIFC